MNLFIRKRLIGHYLSLTASSQANVAVPMSRYFLLYGCFTKMGNRTNTTILPQILADERADMESAPATLFHLKLHSYLRRDPSLGRFSSLSFLSVSEESRGKSSCSRMTRRGGFCQDFLVSSETIHRLRRDPSPRRFSSLSFLSASEESRGKSSCSRMTRRGGILSRFSCFI